MAVMSLHPQPIGPIPEQPARVAHAAFPIGHPSLTLRDPLGTMFQDDDFATLFPAWGYPGLPPWRLALVTIMQFRETLADRQAAEAVRARIDWKYLLGLELTDPGFDFSVLSECRDRLLAGSAEELLLEKLLERCRTMGLLKARGQQRTDSTHVLAAIRVMHRLELVAETLRAALNELATVAPAWLQGLAPLAWYERYGRRIEDTRLPQSQASRDAYAQMVGEDGFALLDALEAPETPAHLREFPVITTLRQPWQRHYDRATGAGAALAPPGRSGIRCKPNSELPPAAAGLESPSDPEARYRQKCDTQWTGYMVPISETGEPTVPHLLTQVHTTSAAVYEAQCTAPIHEALSAKDLAPREPFVDGAYISAALLATSRDDHGITLRGPTRPIQGWQAHTDGAYDLYQFTVDWEQRQAHCPQGKVSTVWREYVDQESKPYTLVRFSLQDCRPCHARPLCSRTTETGRRLHLPSQEHFEALQEARAWYASEEGRQRYQCRAGVEGTLSQGVRAFGLRRTRYRGLAKTHLQHVAIAAAIKIDRIVAWLEEQPRATTRTSRFAALAPVHDLPAETPAV
jgi:transposase